MKLNEQHNEKLKRWSVSLNISTDKLKEKLIEYYNTAKERFSTKDRQLSEEQLIERAFQLLYNRQKAQFLSSAEPFEGFLIWASQPRDLWAGHRKDAINAFLEAVENNNVPNVIKQEIVKLEGDALKRLMDLENDTLARVQEAKKIIKEKLVIPLCPKSKSDGTPSKIAGQPIRPPEETRIQTVYGVGKPAKKDGDVKMFELELQGKATKFEGLPFGKPVSFKAINNTKEGYNNYQLKSYSTDFIPVENPEMEKTIEITGIPKLVKKFFGDFVVTAQDIGKWNKTKKVPDKHRYFVIVDEADVISMNLNPDRRNNITITVDTPSPNAEIGENTLSFCKGDAEQEIDFAEDSRVMVLGSPWLPTESRGDSEPSVVFLNCSFFALPEWKVTRAEFNPLKEEDVQAEKPVEKKEEEQQKINEDLW